MILTCPSCGTQYVVKDGAIPPAGRQVRCKACGHSWREIPGQAPDEVSGATGAPVPPPMEPAGAEAIDEPREHLAATQAVDQPTPAEETDISAEAAGADVSAERIDTDVPAEPPEGDE